MSNLCRICLKHDDTSVLTDIFAISLKENLSDKVRFVTGVEILKDDDFTKMICDECCELLSIACEIKRTCIESDKFLRSQKHQQECAIDRGNKEEEEQLSVLQREKVKNKRPQADDYRCFICNRIFNKVSEKDAHVKTDHASDSKMCQICNRKKQTAQAFEAHLKFHLLGYRFLCQTCGKSFRYKNLLENHLRVEHEKQVYECDMCGCVTKFKINLQRHIKSFHLRVRNFLCPYEDCKSQYTTRVALNLHLYRLHNHQAPVSCDQCEQGFTFESELRVHQKHCTRGKRKQIRIQDAAVDILESGYRCQVCLKIFDSRSKFSVHFNHKHKRSNICEICSKQLSSSTSLLKHIKIKHQKIRRYQCETCRKTFGHKHTLESHLNVHTGDKPFKCPSCNFVTGNRSSMSKHKKKFHSS